MPIPMNAEDTTAGECFVTSSASPTLSKGHACRHVENGNSRTRRRSRFHSTKSFHREYQQNQRQILAIRQVENRRNARRMLQLNDSHVINIEQNKCRERSGSRETDIPPNTIHHTAQLLRMCLNSPFPRLSLATNDAARRQEVNTLVYRRVHVEEESSARYAWHTSAKSRLWFA